MDPRSTSGLPHRIWPAFGARQAPSPARARADGSHVGAKVTWVVAAPEPEQSTNHSLAGTLIRAVNLVRARSARARRHWFRATSPMSTLGVAGAVAVSLEEEMRVTPPDVRAAYPVGSGDSCLAGLAVALVSGASFTESARRGMAAAVANALVPGAGDLDRATAEGLLDTVVVSA
jgi:bifunctional ADP-heptose synthase (sugar kinase/adenylyltransferase)